MISSIYLWLLIFLPPILIPACNSSSPAFLMMCSAYRLNKQEDNKTTLSYSFLNLEPISCSIQGSNYCFFTLTWISQEAGKMVWYSDLLKSFSEFVMIHIFKSFSVVDETEVDVFPEVPWFLYEPVNVGNLISGSSTFPKPNLDIWKFLVHIMLKSSIQNFKHELISIGDECNCPVVWTFFITTLLGNWNEDWPFPVLWPLLGLPDLLTYWVQHLDDIILEGFE